MPVIVVALPAALAVGEASGIPADGDASELAVVAVALTGLLVLGFRPLIPQGVHGGVGLALGGLNLAMAVLTLLKGKIWTGLLGLFIPVLLYVGAIRLARPGSPWARWRYRNAAGKQERAVRREVVFRRPIVRAKIWLQELVAGRHDLPPAP